MRSAAAFAHYGLGDVSQAAASLKAAREALPSMGTLWALTEARMRRYNATVEGAVKLDDLAEASILVRVHIAEEQGTEGAPEMYRRLQQGAFDVALQLATEANRRRAVLRLVATSDGADPASLRSAATLDASGPMSLAEAVAGLVIARKVGQEVAPFEAAIREQVGRDAATVLAFGDPARLEAELEALEVARKRLIPEHRGHAAVLGIGVLGSAAPAPWRREARRFLFGSERPFLRDSPAADGAAAAAADPAP